MVSGCIDIARYARSLVGCSLITIKERAIISVVLAPVVLIYIGFWKLLTAHLFI